jgi:hypothetical protein
MNAPTIVTMFYNIREKENIDTNRTIEKYFELAKTFILQLPYPLIVFTDDDKCIDLVVKERQGKKTYISKTSIENTYFYKDLNRLNELQNKFNIINRNPDKDTPMYIILNNNKFHCIESAIQLNPFKSTHFVWMDFGINHVALNTEEFNTWIHEVPDKIKQLCINPYTETREHKNMFQYIYHHTAGGLFSGNAENLLKYSRLFKEKTEQIYAEEWFQLDEAVMTIVQKENPELFDLYYGDYPGIISNYLRPFHNIELIIRIVQKYINYDKAREAFNTLCYCKNYFSENPDHPCIYQYIQQHIIVDYYHNNRLLLESVIDLIHLKQKIENSNDNKKTQINILLENNKNNIDFYENAHLF